MSMTMMHQHNHRFISNSSFKKKKKNDFSGYTSDDTNYRSSNKRYSNVFSGSMPLQWHQEDHVSPTKQHNPHYSSSQHHRNHTKDYYYDTHQHKQKSSQYGYNDGSDQCHDENYCYNNKKSSSDQTRMRIKRMDSFTSSLSLSPIKSKAPSLSPIRYHDSHNDSNFSEHEQRLLSVKDRVLDFNGEGRGQNAWADAIGEEESTIIDHDETDDDTVTIADRIKYWDESRGVEKGEPSSNQDDEKYGDKYEKNNKRSVVIGGIVKNNPFILSEQSVTGELEGLDFDNDDDDGRSLVINNPFLLSEQSLAEKVGNETHPRSICGDASLVSMSVSSILQGFEGRDNVVEKRNFNQGSITNKHSNAFVVWEEKEKMNKDVIMQQHKQKQQDKGKRRSKNYFLDQDQRLVRNNLNSISPPSKEKQLSIRIAPWVGKGQRKSIQSKNTSPSNPFPLPGKGIKWESQANQNASPRRKKLDQISKFTRMFDGKEGDKKIVHNNNHHPSELYSLGCAGSWDSPFQQPIPRIKNLQPRKKIINVGEGYEKGKGNNRISHNNQCHNNDLHPPESMGSLKSSLKKSSSNSSGENVISSGTATTATATSNEDDTSHSSPQFHHSNHRQQRCNDKGLETMKPIHEVKKQIWGIDEKLKVKQNTIITKSGKQFSNKKISAIFNLKGKKTGESNTMSEDINLGSEGKNSKATSTKSVKTAIVETGDPVFRNRFFRAAQVATGGTNEDANNSSKKIMELFPEKDEEEVLDTFGKDTEMKNRSMISSIPGNTDNSSNIDCQEYGSGPVASLVAKLNSVRRDNPAVALAAIDSILRSESVDDKAEFNRHDWNDNTRLTSNGEKTQPPIQMSSSSFPMGLGRGNEGKHKKKEEFKHENDNRSNDDDYDNYDSDVSSITNPTYQNASSHQSKSRHRGKFAKMIAERNDRKSSIPVVFRPPRPSISSRNSMPNAVSNFEKDQYERIGAVRENENSDVCRDEMGFEKMLPIMGEGGDVKRTLDEKIGYQSTRNDTALVSQVQTSSTSTVEGIIEGSIYGLQKKSNPLVKIKDNKFEDSFNIFAGEKSISDIPGHGTFDRIQIRKDEHVKRTDCSHDGFDIKNVDEPEMSPVILSGSSIEDNNKNKGSPDSNRLFYPKVEQAVPFPDSYGNIVKRESNNMFVADFAETEKREEDWVSVSNNNEFFPTKKSFNQLLSTESKHGIEDASQFCNNTHLAPLAEFSQQNNVNSSHDRSHLLKKRDKICIQESCKETVSLIQKNPALDRKILRMAQAYK